LQLRNGHNGERCCPGAGHRNGHARRSYENAGAAGIPISLRRQVTLAEHERLTDAATALRMNQPTLSRLLARVELELGTRLFERDARGVHTNPYGEVVLAAARDIAHRYDQLRDDLVNLLDPESGSPCARSRAARYFSSLFGVLLRVYRLCPRADLVGALAAPRTAAQARTASARRLVERRFCAPRPDQL
jgi:hypothetical protein